MASGDGEVTIRVAAPADAPALARFRWEFRRTLGSPIEDEPAFVDRCAPWMAVRLEPPGGWRCWLAESGHQIVGHVWVQRFEKIPNPTAEREHHAYLSNLFVRPPWRGRGIGARLLDVALDWCRAASIDRVILWPTERSRTLYERRGFAVRDDVMEAILDETAGWTSSDR